MNKINISQCRICYVKTGDVVDELEKSFAAQQPIRGGHQYYVYSIYDLFKQGGSVLFLSCNSSTKTLKKQNYSAKTFSTTLNNRLYKTYRYIVNPLKIALELIKFKPDFILCSRGATLLTCFCISRLLQNKLIVTLHTDLLIGRWWRKKIEKFILKNCHSVVCHGPYLRSQVMKRGCVSKKIVEYSASCEDICNFPKINEVALRNLPAFIVHPGKKILLFVGRVEPAKGVYDLYLAYKNVCHDYEDLYLLYAGQGAACEPLRDMICRDNLQKKIFVLGGKTREEIAILLQNSWVAVFPTQTRFPEGRCMAVMEALALGTPTIVPDFGPFKYLVLHRVNGLLYMPDSVKDLEEKIRNVLNPFTRDNLQHGAIATGKKLYADQLSFAEAVSKALCNDAK